MGTSKLVSSSDASTHLLQLWMINWPVQYWMKLLGFPSTGSFSMRQMIRFMIHKILIFLVSNGVVIPAHKTFTHHIHTRWLMMISHRTTNTKKTIIFSFLGGLFHLNYVDKTSSKICELWFMIKNWLRMTDRLGLTKADNALFTWYGSGLPDKQTNFTNAWLT